jgi:pilus assembly protein Flp/PilA
MKNRNRKPVSPPESIMLASCKRWVLEFYKAEDGPTSVEYAITLSLIIVICISGIMPTGNNANATFKTVSSKLGSASS